MYPWLPSCVDVDVGEPVGVTLSLTLPGSVQSLASDPESHFALTNTKAATSGQAAGGTACKGPTTYTSSVGLLIATACPYGTYSLRVVKPAPTDGGSGKVSGEGTRIAYATAVLAAAAVPAAAPPNFATAVAADGALVHAPVRASPHLSSSLTLCMQCICARRALMIAC
jgi:hypothetical protein